jgi:hypothetical protein
MALGLAGLLIALFVPYFTKQFDIDKHHKTQIKERQLIAY